MSLFYGHRIDSSRNILGLAFLCSLMIHLLFFSTFPSKFMSASEPINSPARERVIRVKRISPKDQGQIVDIEDQKTVTKDSVDTDYLSDKNRKVEKQTRSINVTRQQNQSTNAKEIIKESDKKSKYKLDLTDKKLQALTEKSGPPIMSQTSMSNYLPEITIGNETLLNTKEFAFHGFYIRMKREIEGFWHPDRVIAQNQAMHGTYITTINVVLKDDGELVSAKVIKSSGIASLDQEAVEAIEHASPFPNPPKELLNEDRRIHVNWSFIFDRTTLM